MDITTTARHFELSPKTREHAEEKLQRLDRYFGKIFDATVTITKEKFRYQTEISLKVAGGPDLVSREETTDVVTSIDGAIDRLERQVKKHKNKLVDRREKAESTSSVIAAKQAESEAGEAAETD